jgi:hypothetical protein
MARWHKVVLWLSLSLNLLLLVAGLWYHQWTSRTAKELLLLNIRAGVQANESVLRELQSNDPQRVAQLQEALKTRIAEGTKAAEQWQKAL